MDCTIPLNIINLINKTTDKPLNFFVTAYILSFVGEAKIYQNINLILHRESIFFY